MFYYETNDFLHLNISEADYLCIHCNNWWPADYATLVQHGRDCSGAVRTSDLQRFICFACDYFSPNANHMKRHILRHTGEKPYKCTMCDYKSTQKDRLNSHMRTHTGEKPYFCNTPDCDFRSSSKQGLYYHSKTKKHPLNGPTTVVIEDEPLYITGDD